MAQAGRVAFVTGASRGIGAAAAVGLAEAGFDVALAARTVQEGEGALDGAPIEGSLEATAAEVRALGRHALPVRMDLTERASVVAGAARALSEFGRVDVVVNCGIYQGPGSFGPLLSTPIDQIETTLQGDLVNQVVLLQQLVPPMIDGGGGTVVNVTSAVAFLEPPGPVGKGGWGFAYGIAKGGFDRIAGLLNAELGEQGIRAFNIEPGFVVYGERAARARREYPNVTTTPPEAIGAAIAWLATSPDADELLGKRVHGPELCRDRQLLAGWLPHPRPATTATT
jgi:NAD(P)-dependent dehydrogenase (short-subunit alcohol dehydrogenase family)